MDRRLSILNAIIREFIETAEPVGSQTIMMSYHFSVSPATIRNEMADLENEGLICQPHTSAGRIPTDTGYRLYVDELADYEIAEKQAEKALQKVLINYQLQKAREKIYDAVRILSQATDTASFAQPCRITAELFTSEFQMYCVNPNLRAIRCALRK